MALPRALAYIAIFAVLPPPGPCAVVAEEQHSCSADGDCLEDREGEDVSMLLQRMPSSEDMMSGSTDMGPGPSKLKLRALKKMFQLKMALYEFGKDWPKNVFERGFEAWETMRGFLDMLPNITIPSDEEIDQALSPDVTPSGYWQAVAQGLHQIVTSLEMQPALPTAAQVEAACPEGEDCTPSAVVDASKHKELFDIDWNVLPEEPTDAHLGVCYNAPYYYANACMASKLSPNAKTALVTPHVVKGQTCEDLGYRAWPAFYADPFYGWHNNVSLFVNYGMVEWLPFVYLIGACTDCVDSLLREGWGMAWRKQNPQCA